MGKILSGIVAIILLATAFSYFAGSSLERTAKAALKQRGLAASETREVFGQQERAVCGNANGRRFLFRKPARLLVEGDLPPEQFNAVFSGWCA